MEQEIKKLPAKAQLQRRIVRVVLTCAILIIINHLVTPGLRWSLWISAGMAIALIFDIVDFGFIRRHERTDQTNTKE